MSIYYRSSHAELISLTGHTFAYPPHSHVSVYTIGVLLHGAMELRQGHENRLVHAGEWFVAPPYAVHSLVPRGGADMLTLCIHRDIVLGSADISLMDAADEILLPLLGNGLTNREAHTLVMDGVDSLLSRRDAPQPLCCPYIADARRLLEQHPGEIFSTDQLTKNTLVGKDQLIRRFKKELGLTPRRFLLQNRIRMAQRLIEQEMPITEVAQAAGFYDQSHFDKRFHYLMGISPQAYRKAVRAIPVSTGPV
ncbi:MAG: helix-turn-helix domain-containing protein [Azoarcus sp.]|jgi:AraC-like DNA-binding protein/mannose-6-phosphate isomerase-like protein (cupin superfamily)|nr:helix-turn-helix domain-containing protein [Azoarcus sp.]